MPRPFVQLSLEEFVDLLDRFDFQRTIDAVHMHHTFIPRRSQFRGLATIEAMDRDHRDNRKFSDIAQHITIDPEGMIWTGRSWNQPPASAKGHNGSSRSGPFMFEIIGDFDREQLEGRQRETVLAVIAHLQKRFELPPKSLRFHNQMTDQKRCPGDSIRYDDFLREVEAKLAQINEAEGASRAARSEGAPFSSHHAEKTRSATVERALTTLRSSVASRGLEDEGELDEESMTSESRSFLSGADGYTEKAPGEAGRGLFERRLTAEEKTRLRPHVINLREGKLIKGGDFFSLEGDVRAIFTEHLDKEAKEKAAAGETLRLLFYAHGGLVKEAAGLHIALKHVEWWKDNGVYPIYFIWETGFLETFGQVVRGEEARGVFDALVEFTDAKIEKAARRLGGERIWSGMKRNAERASEDGGGAALVADLLKTLCTNHSNIEIHAVGHSAGSIFHAYFLPRAFSKGVPAIQSLHLMAPAIRSDTFTKQLHAEVGKNIKKLTMFTMKTDFELADNCKGLYRKSLLYLIRNALEPEERAEILGLEESIRRDPALVKLFALEGNPQGAAELVFSKSLTDSGKSASHSTSHGGFDDDPKTMNSVALRILNAPNLKKPYPEGKGRDLEEDPWAPPDLSDLFPSAPTPVSIGSPGVTPAVSTAPAFTPPPTSFPVAPKPFPATPVTTNGGAGGARRALCIGINSYQQKPLFGCVNDARLWADTLRSLGFEARLLLDGEATDAKIRNELRQLVTSSRAGDVVAFQFAGHGTRLSVDVDGDEESGPDEAICPVDVHKGRLIVDDEIGEILAELPQGVNFTLFMDNCNSGNISRFGIGRAPEAVGPRAVSRFLPLSKEVEDEYLKNRRARGGARGFSGFSRKDKRPQGNMLFAACQDFEEAWEINGQGEFTVRATRLLRNGIAGVTNQAFYEAVLQAFGSNRRQTPAILATSDDLPNRPLLAPLDGPGLNFNGAGRGFAAAGAPAALADELQRFAERLRGFHG